MPSQVKRAAPIVRLTEQGEDFHPIISVEYNIHISTLPTALPVLEAE